MTKYTLRRLFVYVTTACVICGAFCWFYKLTGFPAVGYVATCWNDWTVYMPQTAAEVCTGAIIAWVAAAVVGISTIIPAIIISMLIGAGIKQVWDYLMKWSEVPQTPKPKEKLSAKLIEPLLGQLAMEFRGNKDQEARKLLAKTYARTVIDLIEVGDWNEMPTPEDQLPDAYMPPEFFTYWKNRHIEWLKSNI